MVIDSVEHLVSIERIDNPYVLSQSNDNFEYEVSFGDNEPNMTSRHNQP